MRGEQGRLLWRYFVYALYSKIGKVFFLHLNLFHV